MSYLALQLVLLVRKSPSSAPYGGTFPTPFVAARHFPLTGGIGPYDQPRGLL